MAVLHRLLMLAWGGFPTPVQASLEGSRLPVTPLRTRSPITPSPSASLPIRDILFAVHGIGRNPAECGPSRSFVRTTGTGRKARFGPFSVSPLHPSLTQPNHGHFGTDVRSAINQDVRGSPRS